MQHQETRPGINHRLFGSPLPSYPSPLPEQLHLQIQQQHQQQQQQHIPQTQQYRHMGHHQQQGTSYFSQGTLPTVNSLLSPQHSTHNPPPHPNTMIQPHHQTMLSPTQLARSSHVPTYSPYPPLAAQDPSLKIIHCPEPGCNKQFTGIEGYRIHTSTDHGPGNDRQTPDGNQQAPESRPYVCEHSGCGKAFKQYGNLKTHVRKHTGERPYQCTFEGCGKNFAQLGNLKTHEKIHWPIKPYVCDYPDCHRGFTQRGNLKAHLIKVHRINSS